MQNVLYRSVKFGGEDTLLGRFMGKQVLTYKDKAQGWLISVHKLLTTQEILNIEQFSSYIKLVITFSPMRNKVELRFR